MAEGTIVDRTPADADPGGEVAPPGVVERILESRRIEAIVALVLVAIATAFLARFVRAMATTPLWTDEIWSVLNFSSQGPVASVSTPNNAIVVNLVNSILPGSDSLDPLRVRFVSILAVVAMQVLGLAELVRRRWYLPGALLFFAFAVNFQWLDITLQARGYGVLGFCAMAASIATWRHLEDDRTRWLVALAVISVVGVWTVPSFAFLAAPLWLALIIARRTRAVVLAAVASGIVALALYSPILGDLWNQSSEYAESFGNQYGTVVAPFRTIRNFLWERQGASITALVWAVAFVAPLLVAIPAAGRGPAALRRVLAVGFVDAPRPVRQTVWALGASVVGVFLIALALTTPPQRTVAYVVVPIAVSTAISIAVLREGVRFRAFWRSFTLVAAVLACIGGVFAVKDLSFTPIENWRGAADAIETTFPDGTDVYALTRGSYLDAYLDGGAHRLVPELDEDRLRAGTLVVAAFDPVEAELEARAALADLEPNLAQMDVVQRRGTQPPRSFPVLFAPPVDRRVERVTVDGDDAPELADGDLGSAIDVSGRAAGAPLVLDVEVAPGTEARSLVVPLARGDAPAAVQAEVTAPDGSTTTVDGEAIGVGKRLITVPLGDRAVRSVRLTISPTESGQAVVPRDVWVYAP